MRASPRPVTSTVLLRGEYLSSDTIHLPAWIAPHWSDRPEELAEQCEQLRSSCVFLDASVCSDVTALARHLRQAHEPLVVTTVGGPLLRSPDIDFHVDAAEAVLPQIISIVRYANGEPLRMACRRAIDARAIVDAGSDAIREVEVVDISELGVALTLVQPCPAEMAIRLRLPHDHVVPARVRAVREYERAGQPIVGCQFLDMSPSARSALRAALLRCDSGATLLSDSPVVAAQAGSQMLAFGAAMRRTIQILERAAATDVTVLLLGETGTGKELAARLLHDHSPRASRPFVAINCAALPENLVESELFGHEVGAFTGASKRKIGAIERANGGTLFLDEIGDLCANAQAKLLRALQERVVQRVGSVDSIRVDFRLIAATNQDLSAGIARHSFRQDLYFRLNVVSVTLPPLRDRPEDILSLMSHFLQLCQRAMGKSNIRLNAHAEESLLHYPWPGNVRELENLCKRLVALAPNGAVLGPEHLGLLLSNDLPDCPLPSTDLRDILDFCEREIVKRMLDRNGGNRTKTSQVLGISRQALQQKLARFRARTADVEES